MSTPATDGRSAVPSHETPLSGWRHPERGVIRDSVVVHVAVPASEQPNPERGVALLAALLALTLLTLIVLESADFVGVHRHLARRSSNAVAARLLARSAAHGAEAVLIADAEQNPQFTTISGLWARPWAGIPIGSGTIGFQIEDEAGKLDLNRAGDSKHREALEVLFDELDVDPGLVAQVAAWIAPPDPETGAISADARCADLGVPCTPPGRPMASLDELLAIEGFTPQIVARLRPFVTAFGIAGRLPINANTAPPAVLRAAGCRIGDDDQAPLEGWPNDDVPGCEQKRLPLGLRSNVFRIVASGARGDVTQAVEVVVERRGKSVRRLSWRSVPAFASPAG